MLLAAITPTHRSLSAQQSSPRAGREWCGLAGRGCDPERKKHGPLSHTHCGKVISQCFQPPPTPHARTRILSEWFKTRKDRNTKIRLLSFSQWSINQSVPVSSYHLSVILLINQSAAPETFLQKSVCSIREPFKLFWQEIIFVIYW